MRRQTRRPCLALLAVLASSCTGLVMPDGEGAAPDDPAPRNPGVVPRAGAEPGGGGTSAPPSPAGPGAQAAPPESAGPFVLRPLTRLEYDNTVRDLLGNTSRPALTFPAEGLGSSGYGEPGKISEVEARHLADAAEQVAIAATRDLPKLLGCSPDAAGCVDRFLSSFGRRAYRRPLTATELADLRAFHAAARARHDHAGALRLLLQAVLQSPSFLYHRAQGSEAPVREGGLVRLGPYELASRLSYLLWRSMPDEALFAAAQAGKLSTPDEIAAQARRMLADPRARDTMVDFHTQWAHLELADVDKDRKVYPAWSSALRAALAAETHAFIEAVTAKGDGRLETLLTSNASVLTAPVARLYGLATVTATEPSPAALDPTQRSGLFTRGAFLAAQGAERGSHPIRRGQVIWERLVCGEIPPPPMDVPAPKPVSPNTTTRERFAEHSRNACAVGCHALFDPPGFAFENYDGIGAWRAMEAGKPVDASGVLKLPLAGDRPFTNAIEMMRLLAASEDAQRCTTVQWLRYALGRRDTDADAGSLARAHEAFRAARFDLRALLVGIVQSKTFRYRQPATGEVL